MAGAFYMRQSTITFIGTAKDVGNNLPNILHQVTGYLASNTLIKIP